jgi:hypothetical protein
VTAPRLHIKGTMLQLLHERGAMWDHEIADHVMTAYGLRGDYWYGTVRLNLTDLFSCGLLDEIATTVDSSKSGGQKKVLFKFAVNEFGRQRMAQSGLLEKVGP